LKARRDKNQVIIEVQDDGCGIDPLTIKEAIVKKELVSKNEAAKMSTSEILDHVFHPGFSTKDEASDISGRGIGLDVVATHLQNLKGDIRINSTPDQGTVFSIRVPLTLAISQAMLIQLADEILAVPLTYVEETAKFKETDIVEKDEKQYIQIREDLIPVVKLSRFLEYGLKTKAQKSKSYTAIIILDSGTKYALEVDKVLHREEIVIKSLGEQLSKIPFISSGTIFGDGSVALILDISAITKKVEMEYFAVSTEEEEIVVEEESPAEEQPEAGKGKAITRKQITDRLPSALIIDDSLSVRKFVSSVLERNNYSTVLASNGPEALEKLESEQFDIIITDLEMPKMHGFELIEEIRSQERYDDLPIVILTGRVGREHKEKGMKLGANAYIVKPFKENDLVKTLENFIQYSSD
jgi:chemosensory pili system protein ChpA (sensor histidine kinase/response regulator)